MTTGRERRAQADIEGEEVRNRIGGAAENVVDRKRRGRLRRGRAAAFLAVVLLLGFVCFSAGEKLFSKGNILSDREKISDELVPGEIPLYLQGDKRWEKVRYGDGVMKETGCGPTCLSMVVCGLRQDEKWTPVRVARKAEREGFYVEGSGSSWSLMTDGAEELGLSVEQLCLEENVIRGKLESGQPVICVLGPGDFTTTGHFIVLSGEDDQGEIIVMDPNSRERSEKTWDLERIMSQIKNLWSYCLS